MLGRDALPNLEPYRASDELHSHILKNAPPHIAAPDAPSTWEQLQDWYYCAPGHDLIMKVFDGGCIDTIYRDPSFNHAFRAWHETLHLQHDYDFSYLNEVKVGLLHMQSVRKAGLPESDQAAIVYDTIGQNAYYDKYKKFIVNQSLFVAACFHFNNDRRSGIGGIKQATRYTW